MKKLAALPSLGVSALSLGLVGLSVATPVVNAAVNKTQDSKFNVTVNSNVGVDPTKPGDVTSGIGNVNLTLDPMQADTVKAGFYVINNSANGVNVTVKDKDANTSLANGDNNAIAAKAGYPDGNTATWAVRFATSATPAANAQWQAMPANNGTALNVASGVKGHAAIYVDYAASAAATTAPATYTDTVTYTVAAGA